MLFATAGGLEAAAGAPDPAQLKLGSSNALVFDPSTGRELYRKGADEITPIASVTKLMTAMVVLDANQSLDEVLDVDIDDFDYLKGTRSRLSMGVALPRRDMLRLALMASENRAASALARHYPGGTTAFVAAMNAKADRLGMTRTHFEDATGLSPKNVSTARDLARMVEAAAGYPLIREDSVAPSHVVELQPTGLALGFSNSNRLVNSSAWDIAPSKVLGSGAWSRRRRSAGVRSVSRSAMTWMTRPSRCRVPVAASRRAVMTTARNRSKRSGQRTRLAKPVSSSSVAKITPLALPGRWRTRTRPQTVTRGGQSSSHSRRAVTACFPVSQSRRNTSGCAFSDSRRLA